MSDAWYAQRDSDIVKQLRASEDYFMNWGCDGSICIEAADEIERLRGRVSELTAQLDAQLGTPCEQIRHQQEIERLRAALRAILDDPEVGINVTLYAREALRGVQVPPQEDTGP